MAMAQAQPLGSAEIRDEIVEGAAVFGPENQPVGHVRAVLGQGDTARVVIESGGLFCIAGRRVAVPVALLAFRREENGSITAGTSIGRDAFAALPEHGG